MTKVIYWQIFYIWYISDCFFFYFSLAAKNEENVLLYIADCKDNLIIDKSLEFLLLCWSDESTKCFPSYFSSVSSGHSVSIFDSCNNKIQVGNETFLTMEEFHDRVVSLLQMAVDTSKWWQIQLLTLMKICFVEFSLGGFCIFYKRQRLQN